MADAPAWGPETIHIMNGNEAQPTPYTNGTGEPMPGRYPVKDPIDALVKDLVAVRDGGQIGLFCGEADPFVYNSRPFLEAARDARETRKARITAITGPLLLVPEDESAANGLIQLVRDKGLDGELNLYHRRVRFTLGHFRVVESDDVHKLYREQAHLPGEGIETRRCDNMDEFSKESIRAQALDALARIETWKTMALPHVEARQHGLPLLATPSDLTKIMARVLELDLDFNYLEPAEIQSIATDVGVDLVKSRSGCAWKASRRA